MPVELCNSRCLAGPPRCRNVRTYTQPALTPGPPAQYTTVPTDRRAITIRCSTSVVINRRRPRQARSIRITSIIVLQGAEFHCHRCTAQPHQPVSIRSVHGTHHQTPLAGPTVRQMAWEVRIELRHIDRSLVSLLELIVYLSWHGHHRVQYQCVNLHRTSCAVHAWKPGCNCWVYLKSPKSSQVKYCV